MVNEMKSGEGILRAHRRPIKGIAMAYAVLVGCQAELDVVVHPIIEKSRSSAAITLERTPSKELRSLQDRLSRAERVLTIGTFNGPPGTVLSRPIDVVETESGMVLVLDAGMSEIRSFDSVGSYLGTIIAKGPGPREVMNPVSIELLRSANKPPTLLVATRTEIKLFNELDEEPQLLTMYQSPKVPFPVAACTASDRFTVRSNLASDGVLLASFTAEGDSTWTGGDGYTHGSRLARRALSKGPMGCMPDGTVVAAFDYWPTIRAFDSAGTLRWESRLIEFAPLLFKEERTEDGRASFTSSSERAGDMVISLVPLPSGAILLQVISLSAATPASPKTQVIQRRLTFLLSASTGQGTLLSDSLPPLVAATSTTLWGVAEGPEGHPIVVKFKY
jgi:hypothetical protein